MTSHDVLEPFEVPEGMVSMTCKAKCTLALRYTIASSARLDFKNDRDLSDMSSEPRERISCFTFSIRRLINSNGPVGHQIDETCSVCIGETSWTCIT